MPKRKDRPGVDRAGRTPLQYAACDNLENEVILKNSYGVSALELALDSYSEATRDCPVSRFFDDLNSSVKSPA